MVHDRELAWTRGRALAPSPAGILASVAPGEHPSLTPLVPVNTLYPPRDLGGREQGAFEAVTPASNTALCCQLDLNGFQGAANWSDLQSIL